MDDRSEEQRSKTMAAVKSSGTTLEKDFIKDLERIGLRSLEYHPDDILGKPDIVYRPKKLAAFIDSCFWHGCRSHLRMPNSNIDYWRKKISGNRRRDRRVSNRLKSEGWTVLRIWEHSLKSDRQRKWWITRITNMITR